MKGEGATPRARADLRYRLARAEVEELRAARQRGELLDRALVVRSVEAWARAQRAALNEIPAAEADALAEALAQDPMPATAKRELERIIREHLTRASEMAFQLAAECGV
jgi:hypothetical protein